MFILLTAPECEDFKVRIAIDKILLYAKNTDGNGSVICLVGGEPTVVEETPEEIDKIIYSRMNGYNPTTKGTGPK